MNSKSGAGGAALLNWFQTLADTTRVRLLRLLESNELSVSELCEILQAPQSTVSRHLKVLAADGWTVSRREGTTNLYRAALDRWQPAREELWNWVRQRVADATWNADQRRLERVLASRRRSEAFFSSASRQWNELRARLFGHRLDAHSVAAALPPDAVVGELGCGSAPLAELLVPHVRHIYAIDNSAAMLQAAAEKLGDCAKVTCLLCSLTELDLASDVLDIAWLVLVLPYLEDPIAALREAARVLKPNAPLVIVDLLPHDRAEYKQEMGHLRLGVGEEELQQWLAEAGLTCRRFVRLPEEEDASGPSLFLAVADNATKNSKRRRK